MSAFDPLPPPSAIQRALPVGTRIEGIEIGPAVAEDAATVTYRATGPRGEFLQLIEYMPAQIALREPDGALLSVADDNFRAGLGAFLDEARVLQRADHPALIGVLDVIETRGTAYRTSRWVDGTRLVDVRRQMTEPPDEEALRELLEGLLGGLNAWQREGGLHGAVTPANILLLGDDRPLLLGPNRALPAIASDRVVSLMTTVEPSFAPIEQIAPTADVPLGPTADYFALAGVIRYCISGQLPPSALAGAGVPPRESMRDLGRRVRQSWPRLHYGEALLDTLEAALSQRPADRPQSVAQFRAWLNVGPEGVSAPWTAPPPRAAEAAGAPAPITIDPIGVPPAPPVPPRATRTRAGRPAPVEPVGGFEMLGSIPAPERDAETTHSFFGLETDDGRSDRFDHFERFDRIDHDVRRSTTPPLPPKPRRRWGLLTATALAVLLVIGAVAGVREYERRIEADRTLEIARGAIGTPAARPAPAPAAPPRGRELALPTEPTAAGPAPTAPAAGPPAAQVQPQPQTSVQTAPPQLQAPTVPDRQAAAVQSQHAPSVQAPQAAPTPNAAPPAAPASPQATLQQPAVSPPPAPQQPLPSTAPQARVGQPAAGATTGAPVAQSTVPTVQVPAPAAPVAPPAQVARNANPAPAGGAAAPRPPASPREVCGPRSEFSLYRCMTQQCALQQWRFHAQCERLRRFDRVD